MFRYRMMRIPAACLTIIILFLCGTAAADPCEDGHTLSWVTVTPSTCIAQGEKSNVCSVCGYVAATESLPLADHSWSAWSVAAPASCSTVGVETRTCSVCAATENRSIPATGHTWGAWTVVTPVTCTSDGTDERVCSECYQSESRTTAATGHSWGEWTVAVPAGCTSDGTEERVCANCSQKETRSIAATGHSWGDWTVAVSAGCTSDGTEERVCANCSQKETRPIAATGHSWGEWTAVSPASCTEAGTEQRVCSLCGASEARDIPALNHPITYWEVVEEATVRTAGKRLKVCNVCGAVLKEESIPSVTLPNNSLCSFGLRLRDTSDLPGGKTELWYMYTPFDASVEGEQTFELVASNLFIVGTVSLDIRDGYLTVDYTLNSSRIRMNQEFFTIVGRIQDLPAYEPDELLEEYGMPLRTPIPLKETFGSDTHLVLYMCCRATYQYDSFHMSDLTYFSQEHQEQLTGMRALMD